MSNYEEYVVRVYKNKVAWTLNDQMHRVGAPAVEFFDGSYQVWYRHGKIHREDGPAVISKIDNKIYNSWYLNGVELPKEVFDQEINKQSIKDPLHLKEVEIDGKKYQLHLLKK